VVRGPASVLRPKGGSPRRATWRASAPLVVAAAAWIYFLIPKLLPVIQDDDTSRIVAGAVATVLIVIVAAGVATLADAPVVVPLVLLGAALVAGAMNAAGVGAAATVPETVAYACVGILVALWLNVPALVLAIPVFVAGIEVIGALGGTTHGVAHGALRGGDPLSLELPDWHNGLSAARLGLADIVFAGIYATYARRMGLRFVAGAIGMAVGLAIGLSLSISQNTALPELGFLGAGFLIPNIDRVLALFRPESEG
jgi:hypothetical protein